MMNAQKTMTRTSIATLAALLLLFTAACDRPGADPAAPQPGAEAPGATETEPTAPGEAPGGMEGQVGQMEQPPQPANQPPNQAAPTAPKAPAQAQPDPRAEAPPTGAPQPPPTGEISDDELKAFLQIAPKVEAVEGDFRKKIGGAESAKQAEKIQKEARAEVEELFASSELEPQQYAAIATRLSTEPDFRQRVEQLASP